MKQKSWIGRNWLILLTGALIGVAALVLSALGNPGNMGFCIACFERDIAGSVGLHSAGKVQYFRPEIVGIVFGALLMAVGRKEFKGKAGSSPVLRFVLGAAVMIGALVFLGCPLRMLLRLGGGDPNAIVGLVGFIVGILVGVFFLKKGFTLRRAYDQSKLEGSAFPAALLIAFLLCVTGICGLFRASAEGPGAAHAPWYVSIIAGLLVGALAQRSRFCMAGGIRDAVMFKDFGLVSGSVILIVVVLVGNLILGNLKSFSFYGQPIASADGLWNFLGMVIVGWGSTLLGGCPLRQLVLTGEGNSDSAVTVLGMIAGAAVSHNFNLASGPSVLAEDGTVTGGSTENGHIAVLVILAVLVVISVLCTFVKKKEKKNG